MVSVIAFDVNETLLDLRALDKPFQEVFGDGSLRSAWFAQMLQLSFVGAITGRYIDFTTAQHAALRMVAKRVGVSLDEARANRIVDTMRRLPPHSEVADALRTLRGSRLGVAALTNSPADVVNDQLSNADLSESFDRVISADSVRRLKPAPEPYHEVARLFEVSISEVRLVAAHAWDVTGALAAGCQAAFVERAGMILSDLGPQPDIIGPDIGAVVDEILKRDG